MNRLANGAVRLGLLFFSVFMASLASASQEGGLNTFLSVDMVGEFNADKSSVIARDAFELREVELAVYSAVDHLFEGMLNMAAHREDGTYIFEVHEAFLSTSKLIPYSKLKVGQFFLGIGRLNRVHRHDWPFISAPEIFQAISAGDEGVADTGIEYSLLAPLSVFVELTAGITNGWTFGHAHSEGEKPKFPTHYLRLANYFEPSDRTGIAWGLNYLGRKDHLDLETNLWGLDFVAKRNAGSYSDLLLQAEVWQKVTMQPASDRQTILGAYVFPQLGFSKNIFLGCRFDYYSLMSLEDALGEKIDNASYALVPTFTYKTSEFGSFKLAYQYKWNTTESQPNDYQRSIELQANFIMGAHPAHDF